MTTLNPSDKTTDIALSNGNLTATHSGGGWGGVRSTTGKTTGNWYFEVTSGAVATSEIGIASSAWVLNSGFLGGDVESSAYIEDGSLYIEGALNSMPTYASTDVICVAVSKTNNKVWFRKNGGNWNNDAAANPATNTNGYSITGTDVYIAVGGGDAGSVQTVNFGATAFAQTVPSGFSAWDAPATTSVDSWFQPFREPPRPKVAKQLAVALIASGMVVSPFGLTQKEAVSIDRWLQPLSVPQKLQKRGQFTGAQEDFFLGGPTSFPEATSPDKWLVPFSDPVRRPAGRGPQYQAQLANFVPVVVVSTETITLDKWFVALAEPVRTKPRLQPASQEDCFLGGAAPFTETVSLDRWHQPLSQPSFEKKLRTSFYRGGAVDPVTVAVAATPATVGSWFVPFTNPPWRPPVKVAVYKDGADFVAVEDVPPPEEIVSLDKWFVALAEPVRIPARLRAGAQPSSFLVEAAPFTEKVSIDRWLLPLAEPVRTKPRLRPGLEPYFAFVPVVVSTELVTLDKWFAPLPEPVRIKRGLSTGEQQTLAFVKAAPFSEAVSLDKWLQPLSEPRSLAARRTLPGAQPSSFLIQATPFAEATTLDRWHQPFSRPVPRPPSWHTRAPALFHVPIPLHVFADYVLEVQTSPIITITFPDVTLEVRRITAGLKPPRVRSFEMPWRTFIAKLDPDFDKHHKVIEYEFEDRIFEADPDKRWPYDT